MALFFGFSAARLGISGFESSANFVAIHSGPSHSFSKSTRERVTLLPELTAPLQGRTESEELVRKAGVMGIVLVGGEIAPRDPIVVRLPSGPHGSLEPV